MGDILGVDDHTINNSLTPLRIQLPANVKAISTSETFSLALLDDGTVWGWGTNGWGTLGIGPDGLAKSYPVPVQVEGLSGVTAVSCGEEYALALKNDGTVWMWGSNAFGEKGDGERIQSIDDIPDKVIATPVQVKGIDDVAAISAGTGHNSVAVRSDGTVWSWGYCGNANSNLIFAPTMIEGLSDIVDARIECGYIIALRSDGTVWACDGGDYIGNYAGKNATNVGQVKGLSGIVQVDTGTIDYLALKNDGTVWQWGRVMNGLTPQITTPRMVSLTNVTGVFVGENSFFAIDKNGNAWAWGVDEHGQLGDGCYGKGPGIFGDPLTRATPVPVFNDMTSVSPTATPTATTTTPSPATPTTSILPPNNASTPAPGGWQENWTIVPLAILAALLIYRNVTKHH